MSGPAVSAFERFKSRVVGVLPAQTARCWIFHKWGPWHAGHGIPMVGPSGNVLGVFLIQSKCCSRCNRVRLAISKCNL